MPEPNRLIVKMLGPVPPRARAVLIMVHGDLDTAKDILPLYDLLEVPDVFALAPQAPDGAWLDEDGLERSLSALEALVEAVGVPLERVVLLGFCEGASLALEFAARHPGRYGGVVGLGGVLLSRQHAGSLDGTPVFLGQGEDDSFEETQQALERMGARVELRLYPGAHRVNDDQLQACRDLLLAIAA